jgi:hypothetical protein
MKITIPLLKALIMDFFVTLHRVGFRDLTIVVLRVQMAHLATSFDQG